MSQVGTNDPLARFLSQARAISASTARLLHGALSRAGLATTGAVREQGPSARMGTLLAQVREQALVLAGVVAALLIRYALGATDVSGTFLAYPMVVAWAAYRGGWTSGAVATVASALAIRFVDHPPSWTMVLFLIESAVITGIVQQVTAQLRERISTLDDANNQLGELQRADQRARTLAVSVRSLEALTSEHAIVLLDRQGAIVDWRHGAQRLYGFAADAVRGRSVSAFFKDGEADATYRGMFAETERGNVARKTVWQRRADGNYFEADIELTKTTAVGGDGFSMVVRDRTVERQRQAAAEAAAHAQRALRDEADIAHRQLGALQAVTDPSLNEWAPPHLISELLERLRFVIHADGIALVRLRGAGAPRVYTTPEGLHPGGLAERTLTGLAGHVISRVVFVQNDPARVAEQSFLRWPDGTSSLIGVPVVHAGEVEGTLEVVDRRGRRSTEWEIALMQVVAARVAGLARDPGDRRPADNVPTAGAEPRAQRLA